MRETVLRISWIIALALLPAAVPALAQSQDIPKHPGLEIRFTGGAFGTYYDESFAMEPGFGGSVRYFLSQRFALELEILYSWSYSRDYEMHHKMLRCVPTILYHIISPGKNTSIYVFTGIGLAREWFDWQGETKYSPNETGACVWLGLGVKKRGRIFYSLEARLVGFAASVGYALK